MEAAKERPEKEGTPAERPAAEPAARDDVVARDSPVRCPFCHDGVAVERDAWLACRGCLARHHAACWTERGACAACGGQAALDATAAPPDAGRRRPRARRIMAAALLLSALLGLLLATVVARPPGRVRRADPVRAPAPPGARYWEMIQAAGELPHFSDQADMLIKLAGEDLSVEEQVLLVQLAGQVSHFDHARQVLERVATTRPGRPLPPAVEVAYIEAALGLNHFDAQAGALLRLLEARPLSDAGRARLASQAERISHTHSRKAVLEALVENAKR